MKRWFNATFDIWTFQQLAGDDSNSFTNDGRTYSTAAERLLGTGNNLPVAPSTNRIIRAGGQSDDQSLTSADTFTLGLIDAAVETAKTAIPMVSPIPLMGRLMYVCFISEEQLTDLFRDTSSPVQVVDISLSKLAGGATDADDFLVTAQGFVYRETLVIANTRIPNGSNSGTNVAITNTRRAVFCGEHAASFGYKGGGLGEATFFDEFKNGGKQLQLTGNLIGGLKKAIFNSEDFGSIVISTFAAPHTS